MDNNGSVFDVVDFLEIPRLADRRAGKSQADAILRGESMGAQNTTKGTVELVDPSGKVVLWSGTASDRSGTFLDLSHGGEQKIAGHLIGKLKKAVQPA